MSITRKPTWFALLWAICPHTLPELSMKPFRRQKPIISFVAWPLHAQARELAQHVEIEIGILGNVSTGGSANASSWSRRLQLGRNSATRLVTFVVDTAADL
jgi:hypothetical protein